MEGGNGRQKNHHLQLSFSGNQLLDNLRNDVLPTRTLENPMLGGISAGILDVVEANKRNKHPSNLNSIELLKNYRSGNKIYCGEESSRKRVNLSEPAVRMSTEEIMRVAGQRFVQFSCLKLEAVPMLSHPFFLSFGHPTEEIEDIELADFLLASAEKLNNQEFERAARYLSRCYLLSSNNGNPVQRIVYYFSEALREKLDRESKGLGKRLLFNLGEVTTHWPVYIACHKQVPLSQVTQFPGIQAIVEYVAKAKRIHIIDLCIRHGAQWTLLMQALASRHEPPIELLKITAVGAASKPMEDAGKWLMGFAESLRLPLSYKVITVSDILHLKEDCFELGVDETVAVYSFFFLWTLMALPDRLHKLMGVIRKINPCVMVVAEAESNLNSSAFESRFIEALFYYSAYFDCLDACMERDDQHRMAFEYQLSQIINNIVVADGGDRTVRLVKIDVWRAFFSHFLMVEKDLSASSLYQADLMIKTFPSWSSCTLDMNGKCLIIGWKGTPLHSLSVWKFLDHSK